MKFYFDTMQESDKTIILMVKETKTKQTKTNEVWKWRFPTTHLNQLSFATRGYSLVGR